MSARAIHPDAVAVLERQIAELATDFVLADGAAEAGTAWAGRLLPGLDRIAAEARQAQWQALAQAAEEAASLVRGAGEAGRERLQEYISHLQALAARNQPEAAPPAHAAAESFRQDPELLAEFLVEAREHLSAIEARLLELEQDPRNAEAIHAAFRAFHSIKGVAGFLELNAVREMSHDVETVLDRARNGQLAVTPPIVDLVLAAADWLGRAVASIESGGDEGVADAALLARLRAAAASPARKPEPVAVPESDGQAPGESAAPALLDGRTVKVQTGKLDSLVEMVGEMVIAHSVLCQDPELAVTRSPVLLRKVSQLSRITSEVQRMVTAMRMVPIGNLFRRMVRVARDVARKTGKEAELQFSGEETELDRTIVEELADPLVHMIRNAIDHGIEPAAERVSAGKQPAGCILLRASHLGGQILLEVSDDGRGLDRRRILAKAAERGLLPDRAEIPDQEVFSLILHPGFSTAERVSDLSGRGVGMDVVRKKIQSLRGRIQIRSTPGGGTTFLLKLPLTLAIIEGLVVAVGGQRYVVPIFAVREVLRPRPGTVCTIQGRLEFAMVRESAIPVVRLARVFGLRASREDPCDGLLIIAEAGPRRLALLVDGLIGKQEIVIKNMGEALQNTPGVAGSTILGDGRVGLILDIEGFFGTALEAEKP